ncbi:MAG: hypothetical protein GX685_12385 [Clostridiales bacterium]|nr:hypothetical protein [Clostridiales bacterium]
MNSESNDNKKVLSTDAPEFSAAAEDKAGEEVHVSLTEEEIAANKAAADLQKKKKKKKRRNRIIVIIVIVLAATIAYGSYKYKLYQEELAAEEADVLAVSDGEELIYGEITSIIGNDMTISVLETGDDSSVASSAIAATSGSSDDASFAQSGGQDSGMTPPSGDSSQAVSMVESSQTMPMDSSAAVSSDSTATAASGDSSASMESSDTAISDGQTMGAPTGAPTGTSGMTGENMGGASTSDQQAFTETGETAEYEIPVGTDVTTRLGSTTTFSKLSSGDVVGIILEDGTDNILRIKIVE